MSECRGAGCTHPDCNTDSHRDLSPAELRKRLADALDPIVKYDGAGQPVRASDLSLGNRAERRALAREARRRR